jgi:hypothetical protein
MSLPVRNALVIAGLVGLLACSSKDAEQPPADFQTPGAPAQPMPAKFAAADFAQLRYLEGTWRGSMANGQSFYESFHFLDDSTVLQGSHTDSTFKTKSDSSRIVFRGGAVYDSGGTVSVAEKLDSSIVDFRTSPTYHFTWRKTGPDDWTATLMNKNADGTERTTIYPMKRIKP